MKLVSLENLSKYNELLSQKTVRSVNSIKPDSNGNVQLGTEKSTFNKVVYDTGYFSIGTAKTYNFDLTGSDLENVSKDNINIRLIAKVVTAGDGYNVGDIAQLTTAIDTPSSSYNVDVCALIRGNTLYIRSASDPRLSINNGTNYLQKANVQIKAVLTAFIPDDGSILLIAEDQTNTSKLIGLPDGTLTYADKNLVRSVNGVDADTQGNVTISSLIPNQIIQSPVPLTDANLHLLDGALLSGSGAYADYVAMMSDLYNADPTATCWTDEESWQTSVSTYGECGKFVYDSVNNTLRLPKLISFVQATSSANELGSLVEAGLPNITGQYSINYDWCSIFSGADSGARFEGAFTKAPTISSNEYRSSYMSGGSGYDVAIDASRSSSIYGNNSTVQPQAIKYYFYIVIGIISKTDIQINVDNVMSDLALKADKDLSNVSGIVRNVNGVNTDIIKWETDYFDIVPSGLYSFDLSNTPAANIPREAINIQMVGKVKTAQNEFKVDDYVYPQFDNYFGNGSDVEIGSTPYISGNVLSIRFGNSSYFVVPAPNNPTAGLAKTNVKVKLILTALIEEV